MDASIINRMINSNQGQMLIEEYSNDKKKLTLSLPDSNLISHSTRIPYKLTFAISDGKKSTNISLPINIIP